MSHCEVSREEYKDLELRYKMLLDYLNLEEVSCKENQCLLYHPRDKICNKRHFHTYCSACGGTNRQIRPKEDNPKEAP